MSIVLAFAAGLMLLPMVLSGILIMRALFNWFRFGQTVREKGWRMALLAHTLAVVIPAVVVLVGGLICSAITYTGWALFWAALGLICGGWLTIQIMQKLNISLPDLS